MKKDKIKILLFIFILLLSFIFIFDANAEQSKIEIINSKIFYINDGIIIPSSVQNGKFNSILIFNEGIEKIFLDNYELDIIDNKDFKISFFALPLNNKKSIVNLSILKNGNIIKYKIPVIEKEPYSKSIIILNDSKKQIVSAENSAKRDEETKFFNRLLNYKSYLRYFTLPFFYPLENIKIVSPFGNSRIYKDTFNNILYSSTHLGVDLLAFENSRVYAISTGRVAFAGFSITRGNCIYLDHGFGLYSSYFHLNKLSVKEGQIVFAGELIGFSGNTGVSTGPHLHLGAIFSAINIDPISLIDEMNQLEENFLQVNKE
ncbi:MAG: M23 family metallopeptidase [Exilispira sp.]